MNKNRFLIILKHEYLTIVGKKSFVLTTLLTPILFLLVCAVPILLSIFNTSELKNVAVIDETGKYAASLQNNDAYHFTVYDQATNGNPRMLYEDAQRKSSDSDDETQALYAVVLLPRNIDTTHQALIYSDATVSPDLMEHIQGSLSQSLTNAKIKSYGIDGLDKILEECNVDVDVRSIKWNESGDEEISSAEISMILGMGLSMLSYMFVLMYGAMIMNSVIEEKTNRIVEVIVGSCKPIELMLGKIIGVALVGITQVAIWSLISGIALTLLGMGSFASLMVSPQSAEALTASAQAMPQDFSSDLVDMILSINYGEILCFFIIYFIGGFLLYASLFAAFGSAVDQASDASQFTTPVMMIIIVALYASIACMQNPDGNVALWCSLIPFTSPMVMMVRLPYDIPVWQTILSIVLLYGSALAVIALSAKIYRTGILLYGKKTSLRDILSWLKPGNHQ